MDKQKQIEEKRKHFGEVNEMANEIETARKPSTFNNGHVDLTVFKTSDDIAKYLYNAGYRKIPENAVVPTREEYVNLQALKDEYVKGYEAGVDEGWENAREETAEKIFEELYAWLRLEEISKYGFVTIQKFDFLRKFRDLYKKLKIDEICKEITEGER